MVNREQRVVTLLILVVLIVLLWIIINIQEEFVAGTWYAIAGLIGFVVFLNFEKLFGNPGSLLK